MKKTILTAASLILISSAHAALIDFNGTQSSTNADFVLAGSLSSDNPLSDTFSDAFGAGLDLGVSVLADNARSSSAAVTGTFDDLLIGDYFGDRGNQSTQTYDFTITLTLGPGTYDFTSYNHAVNGNASTTLNIFVDDVQEATALDPSQGSGDLSGVTISTFSTSFTLASAGSVSIGYEGSNNQFGIAGIEVALVPEPSTFTFVGLALAAVVCVRKKTRR